MDIVTILVALVLVFIAWKVLMGVIKFGAIALIAVAAIWFISQGNAFLCSPTRTASSPISTASRTGA